MKIKKTQKRTFQSAESGVIIGIRVKGVGLEIMVLGLEISASDLGSACMGLGNRLLAWGFGNFWACQYILRSSACYLQYEKSMNKLTI